MKRNLSVLVGIGSVAAMLALGIWYLQDRHIGMFYGARRGFMGTGMMAGNGMGIVMMLLWVVFFAAIVWAVFRAVSGNHRGSNGKIDSSYVLEILRQRYAKGEIDKTEYEVKRRDLTV